MARHESRKGILLRHIITCSLSSLLSPFLSSSLRATLIATFFLALFVSNATHAVTGPCQVGDPTCECGTRNFPPEYVSGPSGPRIYDACENLVLVSTTSQFEILNVGWGGPGSSYPEVLNTCRLLSDQSIANGTNASSCYVVEAGQPDPGIFRPDFFVLTPIPVYNVPIIRYIDYLINNTGYSARIIQYGWSGAGICPPGQTRDPATGDCSKCPADDIPDYGPPDPYPLDTANLTRPTQSAVGCLRSCTGIVDAPALLASGYRPIAYQNHLAEIWAKREELKKYPGPECDTLRAKIENEFTNIHQLGASTEKIPFGANCHSSGTCFDVNSSQIPRVDLCASICNVDRPLPVADPGHTVPY